ncbi:hypothetical protein L484_004142 [Morus notabilis]|uniref:Uncharacterized protein n=1 Tax=Morus notabilis TaxID=981085 RepID=W9SG93_9ROSA|nr:hypothetical protein L484_004142 [Morus notabilis]
MPPHAPPTERREGPMHLQKQWPTNELANVNHGKLKHTETYHPVPRTSLSALCIVDKVSVHSFVKSSRKVKVRGGIRDRLVLLLVFNGSFHDGAASVRLIDSLNYECLTVVQFPGYLSVYGLVSHNFVFLINGFNYRCVILNIG